MNIFRIFLNDLNTKTGHRIWMNVESSAKTVAELMQRLDEDRLIYGWQLFTRVDRDTPRTLEVINSKEVILGREAIYRIEVADDWRFVRYEEA